MDFPAPVRHRYVAQEPQGRNWRRTAFVTAAIATVELAALIVIALAFIAKPFADSARPRDEPAAAKPRHAVQSLEPRSKTRVLVLNGNGVDGAAGAAAQAVRRLDYPVAAVSDASRHDFGQTLVMYRDHGRREALRLVEDLGLPTRRALPLDGLKPSDLHGAQLALIVGKTR